MRLQQVFNVEVRTVSNTPGIRAILLRVDKFTIAESIAGIWRFRVKLQSRKGNGTNKFD